MKNEEKKKGSPLGGIIAIGLFVLFGIIGEAEEDGAIAAFGIAVAVFLGIFIFIAVSAANAKKKTEVHSHDRIDHSSDLKVNPNTGRVESAPVRVTRHSAREHWQQQLDGLLANGTIDRAEYQALMNRKF